MPRPLRQRPEPRSRLTLATLERRVSRCERELGLRKRQIGFATDARGERIEQDPDDLEDEP